MTGAVLVLLWLGQTQVPFADATKRGFVWADGLPGQRLQPNQVKTPALAFSVIAETLTISGDLSCTIAPDRNSPASVYSGMIQVLWVNGGLGVWAGFSNEDTSTYTPTSQVVTVAGQCAAVESLAGAQGYVWIGTFGALTVPSNHLIGLPFSFLPVKYDPVGASSGPHGQVAGVTEPPLQHLNRSTLPLTPGTLVYAFPSTPAQFLFLSIRNVPDASGNIGIRMLVKDVDWTTDGASLTLTDNPDDPIQPGDILVVEWP